MNANRRHFLQFLAASTVIAPATRAWAQQLAASHEVATLASAKDALDVMEFEEAARRALPPAHWGYMATGVDDDLTLKANMEAFKHIRLKPRRLVDVSKADLRTEVFGAMWETPIFLCPVGGHQAFHRRRRAGHRARGAREAAHDDSLVGDDASGRGCRQVARHPSLVSAVHAVEMGRDGKAGEARRRRGLSGARLDRRSSGREEYGNLTRFARQDTRNCIACHTQKGAGVPIHRPMYDGLDGTFNPPEATWAYVDRLKKLTRMKVLLKGIDGAEDARLAVEHGVDGLIVSNHGGRATETLRATIDCLPEVVDAVRGGFRSSLTEASAAARTSTRRWRRARAAVGIGRPYIWGLSAFGQEGVERVLDILRAELTLTMRQMGTPSIRDITAARVLRA